VTAASVTAAGRRMAESLMVDTCLITRVTGSTTDPDTGEVTPTTATVYSGRCRMQQLAAVARPNDVGESYVFQQPFVLQLPMVGSGGIQAGDQVEVTASVLDPDLPGRKFWVRELADGTHKTARRIGLEEVTS
jgi:hypothetical protein